MELLLRKPAGGIRNIKVVPDLHCQHYHTGEELYRIKLSEYKSVCFPTWLQSKANEADLIANGAEWWQLQELHQEVHDLDHGPDNTWIMRVLVKDVQNVIWTIITGTWCLLHSTHHGLEAVIDVVDVFEWPANVDDDLAPRTGYKSQLKILANTFRTPSVGSKIYEVVQDVHGMEIATIYFMNMIGRVIITRWGSVQGVERTLTNWWPFLMVPQVLGRLIKPRQAGAAPEAPAAGDADGDPDQDLAALFSKWRNLTRKILQSKTRRLKTFISLTVKEPVANAQAWMMARIGDLMKSEAEAKARGEVYLGPTMLSELVKWKADAVKIEIREVLRDDAWAPLWTIIDPHNLQEGADGYAAKMELQGACREMIIHASHTQACHWDFRVMDYVTTPPLTFLLCLEKDRLLDCPWRRRLSALVLSTPNRLLVDPKLTDMPLKYKLIFYADWEWMYRTGRRES